LGSRWGNDFFFHFCCMFLIVVEKIHAVTTY
jgi:hypothetical protein